MTRVGTSIVHRPTSRLCRVPGAMPVQSPLLRSNEEGTYRVLAGRQVDGPGDAQRERDGHHLAALAGDDGVSDSFPLWPHDHGLREAGKGFRPSESKA